MHVKLSVPVSRAKLLTLIKDLDWKAIDAALAGHPELLKYRGRKGENCLHVCCGIDIAKRGLRAADSIKSADVLLDAGIDINREAFREGTWRATPLWYAIGRGKNLELAKHLLKRGATPEYCLWAAAYNDDAAAIPVLADAGAAIDPPSEDTPLLFAARWSRFAAAKALLDAGANANFQDRDGKTALHYMLKKRSDAKYVRLFLDHGASVDLPDKNGATVQMLLARSRDPRYRNLLK